MAGDSAICGRLAALILRLRPAGLFEEFRSLVKRGGLGLRFSNRIEFAAISQNFVPTRELVAISVRVDVAGDVATADGKPLSMLIIYLYFYYLNLFGKNEQDCFIVKAILTEDDENCHWIQISRYVFFLINNLNNSWRT